MLWVRPEEGSPEAGSREGKEVELCAAGSLCGAGWLMRKFCSLCLLSACPPTPPSRLTAPKLSCFSQDRGRVQRSQRKEDASRVSWALRSQGMENALFGIVFGPSQRPLTAAAVRCSYIITTYHSLGPTLLGPRNTVHRRFCVLLSGSLSLGRDKK